MFGKMDFPYILYYQAFFVMKIKCMQDMTPPYAREDLGLF